MPARAALSAWRTFTFTARKCRQRPCRAAAGSPRARRPHRPTRVSRGRGESISRAPWPPTRRRRASILRDANTQLNLAHISRPIDVATSDGNATQSPRRRLVHRALRRAPPQTCDLRGRRASPSSERRLCASHARDDPPTHRRAGGGRSCGGAGRRDRCANGGRAQRRPRRRWRHRRRVGRLPRLPARRPRHAAGEGVVRLRGERTQRWHALRRRRPGARRRVERGALPARGQRLDPGGAGRLRVQPLRRARRRRHATRGEAAAAGL